MQSIPDAGKPVLRTGIAVALIIASPALGAAQPVVPPLGPSTGLEPIPNGDLVAGLDGWGQVGPTMTLVGGPIIEAGDNTTVVGPAFTVPDTAQLLPIVMGVPGGYALVAVRARPVEGGADIPLATIVPSRAVRTWNVGIGAVRGRTVRIVLDPVSILGRRLYVRGVGPPVEVLPGWVVARGMPVVVSRWGKRGLDVADARMVARTAPFTPSPRTRVVSISVRGAGRITARLRGRSVRASATTGSWTTLRFPVRRRARGLTISFTATPAPGQRLMVAGIGAPAPRRPPSASR